MFPDSNHPQIHLSTRTHRAALLVCLALAAALAGCGAGVETDVGDGDVVATSEEALSPSAGLFSATNMGGARLPLYAGKTYAGSGLAPVGDNHGRSLVVPSSLRVTLCGVANPPAYDARYGVGVCRTIHPAATDGGGIFSTDGGGIFSTDGGGIFSTDGGGIFSYSAPAYVDANGTLSAPSFASGWVDEISWIRVSLAD